MTYWLCDDVATVTRWVVRRAAVTLPWRFGKVTRPSESRALNYISELGATARTTASDPERGSRIAPESTRDVTPQSEVTGRHPPPFALREGSGRGFEAIQSRAFFTARGQ